MYTPQLYLFENVNIFMDFAITSFELSSYIICGHIRPYKFNTVTIINTYFSRSVQVENCENVYIEIGIDIISFIGNIHIKK